MFFCLWNLTNYCSCVCKLWNKGCSKALEFFLQFLLWTLYLSILGCMFQLVACAPSSSTLFSSNFFIVALSLLPYLLLPFWRLCLLPCAIALSLVPLFYPLLWTFFPSAIVRFPFPSLFHFLFLPGHLFFFPFYLHVPSISPLCHCVVPSTIVLSLLPPFSFSRAIVLSFSLGHAFFFPCVVNRSALPSFTPLYHCSFKFFFFFHEFFPSTIPLYTPFCHCYFPFVIALSFSLNMSPFYHCSLPSLSPIYHFSLFP